MSINLQEITLLVIEHANAWATRRPLNCNMSYEQFQEWLFEQLDGLTVASEPDMRDLWMLHQDSIRYIRAGMIAQAGLVIPAEIEQS